MTLAEFQALIRERYFATDSARGAPATFLWFTEEVGELAEQLGKRARGDGDDLELASEFADVLAWLATLANISGVDLSEAVHAKYLDNGGPEDQVGMSRVATILDDLKARRRPALMPFVTAGYPSLECTEAVLPELEEAGASIVELGIPFSDPIADGPVIAASMYEALQAGVTPRRVFDMVARVRDRTQLGLVAMVSDSIVDRMSPERFVAEAAAAGIDGLIVPDIDLDRGAGLRAIAEEHDLSFTLLVAPTTPVERIGRITAVCSGFVYLLARMGLTGERAEAPEIASRVAQVRTVSDLPIACGFGVGTAEHVRAVVAHADAAIVGSALVRRMGDAADPVHAARSFVEDLATGLSPALSTGN